MGLLKRLLRYAAVLASILNNCSRFFFFFADLRELLCILNRYTSRKQILLQVLVMEC